MYNVDEKDFFELAKKLETKPDSDLTNKENFISNYLNETDDVSKAYEKCLFENMHVILIEKNNFHVLVRVVKRDFDDNYSFEVLNYDFKHVFLETKRKNGKFNGEFSICSHSFKNNNDVFDYSEELKTWINVYDEIDKHLKSL